MPAKKTEKSAPVGQKIKKARTAKKLALTYVANETGYAIDFLKKIESGKVMPPVGALLQIARALQVDSGLFLQDAASARRERIQAYTKRTENYAYTPLTPGAENKHLKAFKVTVEAWQDHEGVGYQHEGEEFVYVLSGRVEIAVGDHLNRLQPGETLHFNSGIRHNLKNIGDTDAELLVVIYNP